mmetsp:Transcript_26794/g.67346  ORF Transcript_26794/g.67346 Transcript_26794/m.67346 type:complete len:612 (-) Transcript_26794:751-2586(-)
MARGCAVHVLPRRHQAHHVHAVLVCRHPQVPQPVHERAPGVALRACLDKRHVAFRVPHGEGRVLRDGHHQQALLGGQGRAGPVPQAIVVALRLLHVIHRQVHDPAGVEGDAAALPEVGPAVHQQGALLRARPHRLGVQRKAGQAVRGQRNSAQQAARCGVQPPQRVRRLRPHSAATVGLQLLHGRGALLLLVDVARRLDAQPLIGAEEGQQVRLHAPAAGQLAERARGVHGHRPHGGAAHPQTVVPHQHGAQVPRGAVVQPPLAEQRLRGHLPDAPVALGVERPARVALEEDAHHLRHVRHGQVPQRKGGGIVHGDLALPKPGPHQVARGVKRDARDAARGGNVGQVCVAVHRLLVQEGVAAQVGQWRGGGRVADGNGRRARGQAAAVPHVAQQLALHERTAICTGPHERQLHAVCALPAVLLARALRLTRHQLDHVGRLLWLVCRRVLKLHARQPVVRALAAFLEERLQELGNHGEGRALVGLRSPARCHELLEGRRHGVGDGGPQVVLHDRVVHHKDVQDGPLREAVVRHDVAAEAGILGVLLEGNAPLQQLQQHHAKAVYVGSGVVVPTVQNFGCHPLPRVKRARHLPDDKAGQPKVGHLGTHRAGAV